MDLILTVEDRRIVASSSDVYGVEICGAYKPEGHDYWQLYVSRGVIELTGVHTPPHREHFWGDHGKLDATEWVKLIGTLYCLAKTSHEGVA